MTTPNNLPARSQPSIDWYTPHEVGQMAGGVSAVNIRAAIADGRVRAEYCLSRRGRFGRWRIDKTEAVRYAESLRR